MIFPVGPRVTVTKTMYVSDTSESACILDIPGTAAVNYGVLQYSVFLGPSLHFPAQLVGGFTLSDLLDKPWSQVSSLLPPGYLLAFIFIAHI